MLDNPDLPDRTRPYLDKLLRGLCRFYPGYGCNGNACVGFDSEFSADMTTHDGKRLVEKLSDLAMACADDFQRTAKRHDLPGYNEHLQAASKLWLVADSLRPQPDPDPGDERTKRRLDHEDVAFCSQYAVREVINSFPVDEFDEFAEDDPLDEEAAA